MHGVVGDAEIVAAWQRGDDWVPLLDGGVATLPVNWLERYGSLLADLLAARDERVAGAGNLGPFEHHAAGVSGVGRLLAVAVAVAGARRLAGLAAEPDRLVAQRVDLGRPVDPDDPEDELELTTAGREALGLPGVLKAPPKRMKTALVRALAHFLTPDANLKKPDAIFPPKELPAVV